MIASSGTILKRCNCAASATDQGKLKTWRKCPHTWYLRYKQAGKLIWKSCASEQAAKIKSAEIYRGKLTGADRAALDSKRADMPFVTWAREWIDSPGRNERTRVTYRAALRHIESAIGTRTVRQVADDRQGAKRLLADAPGTYGPKMRNTLTGALNYAMDEGLISSHSLTRMRTESSTKRAKWVPTSHQQRADLADAMGTYGLAVWTAYYLGLRAGESLGLRKSDFMETIGPDGIMIVLRLTRQRQAHSKGDAASSKRDVLKSRNEDNSERFVPVPPELWAIVKNAPTYDDGSLFPQGFNSTLYARVRKASATTGLPETFTLHSLRHQYVSDLQAEGVSNTLIAQVIGHTSTIITDRIYGHQTPEGLAAVLRARKSA